MLPRWLVQLLAVAFKEVRHTLRDRRMMAVLLIAPVLQLTLFGYAVDFDVDHVPTVVVDHDQTAQSREHLRRILADGTLEWKMSTSSEREAERAVDSGESSAILIVPPGFAAELGRGSPAHLQVVVDGTDPNRGAIAAAAVSRYARAENAATLELAIRSGKLNRAVPGTVLAARMLYNPRLRTALYMVPGIMVLLLLVITVIVTSMGLARERETGTLEQIQVTPMGPLVLMVGKLLPYLVIGLFDFLFAVVVATRLFDVPIRGPFWVALLGTSLFVFCCLGVGLLISTVSRTQQQAFLGGFLFLLPTLLLSGIITPLWGIPEWLLPVTRVLPTKYYGEILRGVLLRGCTLSELSLQLGVLGGEGAAVLGFAAWRFRRSLG